MNSEPNKGNPVGWVRRATKGLGSGTKLFTRAVTQRLARQETLSCQFPVSLQRLSIQYP